MNILFTICARAGSKGVKNKNIRCFLGQPLVYYTLAAYQLFTEKFVEEFGEITLGVNTDSKELIKQINRTKIPYEYIERSKVLGGDTVSKLNVIQDTLKKVEMNNKRTYDIIVDLDLTAPIRTVDDIYKIIDELQGCTDTEVVFSMTHSRRSPYFNLVQQNADGFFNTVIQSKFVSRQEAPQCYDMNASMYAYRREFILSKESLRVFDGKAKGVCVMDTAVLDIDNEEDLELMEVLAEYFYKNYSKLREIKDIVTTY